MSEHSFVCNTILLAASNLTTQLSVPVIHKAGNVRILVLLKFENKLETVFIYVMGSNFEITFLSEKHLVEDDVLFTNQLAGK